MRIVIEGKPLPKARHRTYRVGAHSITFDPQNKEKNAFKNFLKNAITVISLLDDKEQLAELAKMAEADAYVMDNQFFIEMPKSWSKKKKEKMNRRLHNVKPDNSNMLKFMEDCGNEILYADDCQLVKQSQVKRWGYEPKTVININPINIFEECCNEN